MSMPAARYYTAEMVLALPDDFKRYETVHGELLVTPAPSGRHQPVVVRLIARLAQYLNANGLEQQLLTSPADISYGHDTLVQPDLFVADTAAFLRSGNWADVRMLHLVIEIVSESSARSDRTIKRQLYQEQRIPEYWIVDTDQRQVEVWTPDARFAVIQRERLVWRHPALANACVIGVPELFDFG